MKCGFIRALVFIATAVLSLVSPASVAGQTDSPSYCTADMLDIRVLPPLEPQTVSEIRALIIELQNRAESSCTLPRAPHIELLDQGGADSLAADDFQDDSAAAGEFQNRKFTLAPGEVVHVVITWPSRGGWDSFPGCFSRDRMTLALDYNQPPMLEVQHLWARLCDRAYVSRFRMGHYSGDPIPATWLKRFHAQPSDFDPDRQISSEQPPIRLDFMSDHEMLNDGFYSQILVSLPHIEFDCPYSLLRKREASGKTEVYLNHCEALTPQERSHLGFQDQKWVARLDVGNLGMAAEQPGTVEYEVISGVATGEKKINAIAKAHIMMMDPEPPALPLVDSPRPDCRAAQLKASDLSPISGGPWHEAHIYNVTNISDQVCRVGGLPRLELLYPPNQSHTTDPKPCPNCSDSLFHPRPSGWIDLGPGDSAHFLVGSTRFDLNSPTWRMKCDMPGLRLVMTAENSEDQNFALPLPFATGTCAQLTVSAWRSGRYDDDPLNIQFDQQDAKRRKSVEDAPLPKDCEKKDFGKTGRPVNFPAANGLEFGLSANPEHFLKGKPIGLYIWQVNPTDQPISYASCPPVFETEVFDFYGHRVLNRFEEKQRENPMPGMQSVQVCTATMMVTLPPHTCSVSEGVMDLSQQYSLPPGEYLVTRRDETRQERTETPSGDSSVKEAPVPAKSEGYPARPGIVIFVDQQ